MTPFSPARLTRAQKAARTRAANAPDRERRKIRHCAHDVCDALQALPDNDSSLPLVPKAFEQVPAALRADVFRLLDEQPGRFPDYVAGHWFRLLRRARNSAEHGPALFAALRVE